jgi:hypothetical protein
MDVGLPKASCKNKRKETSIFTANRFKPSATNIFSPEPRTPSIQQGHAARYPYKKKKHFPTKWAKDGFKVYENGKIELSMGIHHGKREKPIVVYVSHLPKGAIKEIECCLDQGLYLAMTYEDGQKAKAYKPGSSVRRNQSWRSTHHRRVLRKRASPLQHGKKNTLPAPAAE